MKFIQTLIMLQMLHKATRSSPYQPKVLSFEHDAFNSSMLWKFQTVGGLLTETGTIHLIHHLSSQHPYRLTLNFTSRSCDQFDHIKFTLSDETSQFVKQHFGPDEIIIFVEGPQLQAFMPLHMGCNVYVIRFAVGVNGLYRIKVLSPRTNHTGYNELYSHFPDVHMRYILDEEVRLDKSTVSKNCNSYWTTTNKAYLGYDDWDTPASVLMPHACSTNSGVPNVGGGKYLDQYTYVNLSTLSSSIPLNQCLTQSICASNVDLYEYKSDSTCPQPFNHITAQGFLKGKRIVFIGDSHARNLATLFTSWICQDDVTGTCASSIHVHYDALCGNVPNRGTFDVVFMNCGHWLATGCNNKECYHYTAEQYVIYIQKLLHMLKEKKYSKKEFVWVESVAEPFRNDSWMKGYNDWRTNQRLRYWNIIANHIMKDEYPIMPTFYNTLIFSDKLCDDAHYAAPHDLMPNYLFIINHLANITTNQTSSMK
jgi:hypothetical protein